MVKQIMILPLRIMVIIRIKVMVILRKIMVRKLMIKLHFMELKQHC